MSNCFVKVIIRFSLEVIKRPLAQSEARCGHLCFVGFNQLFTRGHIQLVMSLQPEV